MLSDVGPCGACRPLIFFINGVLCFLKIMATKWRWKSSKQNGNGRKMIGDATSKER